MSNPKFFVEVGVKLSDFEKGMKTVQQRIDSVAGGMARAGKLLSVGLTTPLVAFAAASTKAFNVQAQAEEQLLVALGRREDVQKRLIQQAQTLQGQTLFGDEETIRAQALLAAFVEEEEAIKRIIPLVQDMAQAKGMQLSNAADLVAKTLGSTTNAMSRYGIEVTGAVGSTERLETLANGLASAFGGTAKAAAEAGTGGLTQLKNAFGDVQEEIGRIVTGAILPFAKRLKEFFENLQRLPEETKRQLVLFGGILAGLGPTLIALSVALKGVAVAFGLLTSPIALIIAGITTLGLGIKYLIDNWTGFKERFTDWSWWKNTILDMAAFFNRYAPGLLGGQGEAMALGLEAMKTDLEGTFTPLQTFGEFISNTADQIGNLVTSLFNLDFRIRNFGQAVEKAPVEVAQKIEEKLIPAIEKVEAPFGSAREAALATMGSIKDGIISLEETANYFVEGFAAGLANIAIEGGKVKDLLRSIGRELLKSGLQKIFMAFLTGGVGSGEGFFGGGGGLLGSIFPKIFGASSAGEMVPADSGQNVMVGGLLGSIFPKIFDASSAGAMVPALSGQNVMVGGQFQLKGTDLVASITKTQNSILR